MTSSLDELVRAWRERAEKVRADHKNRQDRDLHSIGEAWAYGVAAQELETALKGQDARPPETEEEAKAQARRLMQRRRKTFEALDD